MYHSISMCNVPMDVNTTLIHVEREGEREEPMLGSVVLEVGL